MNTPPNLPIGLNVLASGPAGSRSPVLRLLSETETYEDPVLEGVRLLLPAVWLVAKCSPPADTDLAAFVAFAQARLPQLAPLSPALIAAVAQDMGLPGMKGA